jgi:hypothetical protein
VGVEPDQAEGFLPAAEGLGHAGHRADRYRVVAAEHERYAHVLKGVQYRFGKTTAGVRDFEQVFGFGIAVMAGFGDDDVHVAKVIHLITEFLQLFIQVGIAQRRRPHIHAAPVRAEIHGHSDD